MNKSQIAADFIALHKNSDIQDWLLSSKDLDDVYEKLSAGEFGEKHEYEKGTYSVEISGFESATGNPIIFEWQDPDD